MPEKEFNIDELIVKVLSGEADTGELKRLELWIGESPENAAFFEENRKIFEAVELAREQKPLNISAAWEKLDRKISGSAKVIRMPKAKFFMRAAAVIALIAAMVIVFRTFTTQESFEPLVIASAETTLGKDLPDGSSVVLNRNSEISFTAVNHERRVMLKGEAFFNVVHDQDNPFVIIINGITIRDIGTSFNVKAIPGSDIVEVLVTGGEVEFASKEAGSIRLKKGETATYTISRKEFSSHPADPLENTASYVTRKFSFRDASVREVIDQINEVYSTEIRVDASGANCRLSVIFDNEDPEMIISIIAETLDMRIVNIQGVTYLKGGKCK